MYTTRRQSKHARQHRRSPVVFTLEIILLVYCTMSVTGLIYFFITKYIFNDTSRYIIFALSYVRRCVAINNFERSVTKERTKQPRDEQSSH